MKIYVAHPLRGRTGSPEEVKRNTASVTSICRQLVHTFPEYLFLSPIHAFSFLDPHGEQSTPLALCKRMLRCCDALWVFGDFLGSDGCMQEIRWATKAGLPVFIPARVETTEEVLRRLA